MPFTPPSPDTLVEEPGSFTPPHPSTLVDEGGEQPAPSRFVPPVPIAIEPTSSQPSEHEPLAEIGSAFAQIPFPVPGRTREEAEAYLKKYPSRGTLGGALKSLYQTEEEARKESIGGEYPKFDISKSTSVPGAMVKEAANVAMGLPEFMETPVGGAAAAAGVAAPIPTALGFAGYGAKTTAEAVQEARKKWPQMTTPQKWATGAIDIPADIAMTLLPLHGVLPRSRLAALRTATEKGPNASQISKATEVHGDVRAQQTPAEGVSKPEGGEGVQPQTEGTPETEQQGVLLDPEESKWIEQEREAIDKDIVMVDRLHDEENQPFAGEKREGGGRRVATIRPDGTIEINKGEYRKWLAPIPEAQRAEAVKGLLAEELNHGIVQKRTTREEREQFWKDMSGPEQSLFLRIYTGEWTLDAATKRHGFELSPEQLGYEAMNHFQMRLSKMTPREVAEAAFKEKWTVKTLGALQNLIFKMREGLGTDASGRQRALLDRVTANLDIAMKAVGGTAPGALVKNPRQPTAQELLDMDSSKYGEFVKQIKYSPEDAARWGSQMTEEDIGRLDAEQKRVKAEYGKLLDQMREQGYSNELMAKIGAMGLKSQTLREVVEDFGKQPAAAAPAALRKGKPDKKTGELAFTPIVPQNVPQPEDVARGTIAPVESLAKPLSEQEPAAAPAALRKGKPDKKTGELAFTPTSPDISPRGTIPPMQPLPAAPGPAQPTGLPTMSPGGSPAIPAEAGPRQARMSLPEVSGQVERGGFQAPTGTAIDQAANAHATAAISSGQIPDFDTFLGEQQSRYGAGLNREKAFWPWTDAVQKNLLNAPGEAIRSILGKLNLVDDVAEALNPSDTSPFLRKIPDSPATLAENQEIADTAQRAFSELAQNPDAWRKKPKGKEFTEQQQRRLAAIGAIFDKLAERAGGRPKREALRGGVGPEDIGSRFIVVEPSEPVPGAEGEFTQPQIETSRQVRGFTPDQAADPALVADAALASAREHGAKVSNTKGALAVRDRLNNRIILVSAWRDGRRGPVITNPVDPSAPSLKIDSKLLGRFEPTHAMTLRQPREGLRQVFQSPDEFNRWFGTEGIEGGEGVKAAPAIEPKGGLVKPRWKFERQEGVGTRGELQEPWAGPVRGQNLPLPPEFQGPPAPPSPTSRALTVPRFARRAVPAERLTPGAPVEPPGEPISGGRPGPVQPPAILPPEAQAKIAAQSETELPYKPTEFEGVSPELEKRGINILPGARGERQPGALRKVKEALSDDVKAGADAIRYSMAAGATADTIARKYDDMGNRPHNAARAIENGIRAISATKPTSKIKAALTEWERGDKKVLAAANAAVQSGAFLPDGSFDRSVYHNRLNEFQAEVDTGMAEARRLLASTSFKDRRLGRVYERAGKELRAELDYAQAHETDRTIINTARRMREELNGIHREMKNAGIDVRNAENYLPGRYDMSATNGRDIFVQTPKLWGTKWREPKVFKNYYEAFANGPYFAATRDGASLTGHAVRKGLELINREHTKQFIADLKTPDGNPVAVKPVPGKTSGSLIAPKGYAGYEVVPNIGLAVHPDFAPLVRNLFAKNPIQDWAVTRYALNFEQTLKHNLLIGDFFHLGRMIYYGTALMRRKVGFKGGLSALDYTERDLPMAVRKGIITPGEAAWGQERIDFGQGKISRRDLLTRSQSGGVGFNIGRIQDALYKDVFTQLTPTSGPVRRAVSKLLDPSTGRYNRFLFDKFTRGLMAESLVTEFERQRKSLGGARTIESDTLLLKDISRDLNNYYGNIGRQGWTKAAWQQDLARMVLLAPQWVEGLVKKEVIGASRLTGISKLAGRRQGLSAIGSTGYGMGTGLVAMLALTQAINLITRGKPTWKNEERGHKFDAWIPLGGGRDQGLWVSPLAVFNEISHDVYRLSRSKPTVMQAIDQIVGNKESPILRAALIGLTGESRGQKFTTSGAQLKAMGGALAPVPITFGRYGQAAGHAIAPGVVPPNPPGTIPRQVLGTAGIKAEIAQSATAQVREFADKFMRDNNLKKDTGWQQVMTDQPGYSTLRTQLRNGDDRGAAKTFAALTKNRKEEDVTKAMKLWAKRPFTSTKHEQDFIRSLTDEEAQTYTRANDERQEILEKYYEWLNRQP